MIADLRNKVRVRTQAGRILVLQGVRVKGNFGRLYSDLLLGARFGSLRSELA